MLNFLPLPHPPLNTEQLQILMYSCACLAEHCIACMFCEICFRFVFFFFKKWFTGGYVQSVFSVYINWNIYFMKCNAILLLV